MGVGGQTRAATVDAGSWSYTLADDDLTNMGLGAQITVTARDAAGNLSGSTSRTVTIDTQGPDAPTIESISLDDDGVINEIADEGVGLGFGPDTLAEARNRGYTLATPGKKRLHRKPRA